MSTSNYISINQNNLHPPVSIIMQDANENTSVEGSRTVECLNTYCNKEIANGGTCGGIFGGTSFALISLLFPQALTLIPCSPAINLATTVCTGTTLGCLGGGTLVGIFESTFAAQTTGNQEETIEETRNVPRIIESIWLSTTSPFHQQ